METEGLLQCSQKPTIGLYPQPCEFSSHPPTLKISFQNYTPIYA